MKRRSADRRTFPIGRGMAALLLGSALVWCPALVAQPLTISTRHYAALHQQQQTPLGPLTLVEALVLSSDDPEFGGFSALEWVDDAWLTASDHGYWLAFTWQGDAINVKRWEPIPIDRTALKGRGPATDAESLALAADGGVLLSFEREHRIQHHPTLDSKPDTYEVPLALQAPAPLNYGIEAMATLADGAIFAVTEKVKRDGGFRAYRIRGKRGEQRELYVYVPDGDWLPSGATTLPDGTLLLAERKPTLFGFRARFVTLDPAQMTGQERARLTSEVLATFPIGALASDNIEGIHARDLGDGRVEIVTISDDNFKSFQSTRLLRFVLERRPDSPPASAAHAG